MSGTIEGGRKAAAIIKERHGEDFYKKLGSRGGKASHTGGFAASRERAKEASAKGLRARWSKPKGYNGEVPCNEESSTTESPSSTSSSSTTRPHLGRCEHCKKLRIIVNSGVCHGCVDKFEAIGVDTTQPGWRPF